MPRPLYQRSMPKHPDPDHPTNFNPLAGFEKPAVKPAKAPSKPIKDTFTSDAKARVTKPPKMAAPDRVPGVAKPKSAIGAALKKMEKFKK